MYATSFSKFSLKKGRLHKPSAKKSGRQPFCVHWNDMTGIGLQLGVVNKNKLTKNKFQFAPFAVPSKKSFFNKY
jgi:hypothetical protein